MSFNKDPLVTNMCVDEKDKIKDEILDIITKRMDDDDHGATLTK